MNTKGTKPTKAQRAIHMMELTVGVQELAEGKLTYDDLASTLETLAKVVRDRVKDGKAQADDIF